MKYLLLLAAMLAPIFAFSINRDSLWLVTHYSKKEVYIPMRDGKKLFTAIYAPIDGNGKTSARHPVLMTRSPYSVGPYGEKNYKTFWTQHYFEYLKRGYIMVLQDVRGCYMSEGDFVDVRPYNEDKQGNETDEASDTYDAIDWVVKNVPGNNGNVGIMGISYPGFYATMGALSGHPALKAASPQAPVTEWYLGDDFHHNGAFMMMDGFNFYSGFGKPRHQPTTKGNSGFQYYTKDNYKFYLETGTLRNLANLMGDSIKFWQDLYQHPDYDQFWKARNVRNFVGHIPQGCATLVVGGLFDAEDCYGGWNLYKAIEQKANNNNKLVIGPWSHGGWARMTGEYLGNVHFGSNNSEWYQKNIEIPFFEYYLEGKGNIEQIKEANVFFSGSNEWKTFNTWPPKAVHDQPMYLHSNGELSESAPRYENIYNEYTSDPNRPVPYTEDVHFGRTKEYMTDDQRFASRRPDVLVYETDSLDHDMTLAGPVEARLFTALSTTDADFVVKLIDVFPDDFKYPERSKGTTDGKDYPMGGYQMLVRGEVMRGRYRNSFEHPEGFEPGAIEEVAYTMPDVAHTFKKGHKIMVQIQSTWFPLVDRNPQQFVDIYNCFEDDFRKCDIKIFTSREHPSSIVLPVLSRDGIGN